MHLTREDVQHVLTRLRAADPSLKRFGAEGHGYRLNPPSRDEERGGAVIVDAPNGEAVAQELLRRGIIIDYRPNAGIRMAPHFYNSEEDIDRAVSTLNAIVAESSGRSVHA